MKVVISSGHGKNISGAVGIINEVAENRKVTANVARYLKELGCTVYEFHDDVSKTVSANIGAITAFHNSKERDLDISVHFNSVAGGIQDRAIGTEVLYLTAKDMAAKVSKSMADASGLIDRGAKHRTDLGFLNKTKKPAILLEVCFVMSKKDVELYHKHYDDICRAIAEAVSGRKIDTVILESTDIAAEPQSSLSNWPVSPENIKAMADLGIINSPDYWAGKVNIQYLNELMANAAAPGVCDKRIDNGIICPKVALRVLSDAKIINSPDYWQGQIDKNADPHLGALIVNMANKSRDILERIVWAEARGEGLEGQELVANVILNRVKSPKFPNGIYNVVFANGINSNGETVYQFSPISDGAYAKATPTHSEKQAVTNVLNGKDNGEGATYFCTRASAAKGNWHERALLFLFEHKNHRFYKER